MPLTSRPARSNPGLRTALLLVAFSVGVACRSAAPPNPTSATNTRENPAAQPAASPADPQPNSPLPQETKRFEFRVGFWSSLHHHVRGEARRQTFPKRYRLNPIPGELPEDERDAWVKALEIYTREVVLKDFLSDPEVIALKNALGELDASKDATDLSSLRAQFPPPFGEVLDALEAAAPIYRAHVWPEHERGEREWAATVGQLVEAHERRIVREIERVFATPWPAAPVVTQVTSEAGPTGAYTTLHPTRITIGAFDNRNQGMPALEVLFHEAAHGMVRSIHEKLDAEAARQNRKVIDDLWHAVLFYSIGEIVRRDFVAGGETDYKPYADANGLWQSAWPGLDAILKKTWDPWLDGRGTLDQAIEATVAAAPLAPPPIP